jgi:hypothetical protein
MDWGHGSSGRALASKHKALSSNSSTIKEEKGKCKGQETPSFPPLPAGAWDQLSQVQGTPKKSQSHGGERGREGLVGTVTSVQPGKCSEEVGPGVVRP